MALQFITGNSGSGKSYLMYNKIIEASIAHPTQNYMVIVPEQFTMQTQKDLVMMHPRKGIMNIDVLSFHRLAHRIFEELGSDHRIILTETGKNLMLRKVANEQKDQLQVLGSKMNRPGYISEVKSMLSELMQYEITEFEMDEMLQFSKERPLLHAKLQDVKVLYQAFLQYQKDRFMKPEELLDILSQVAKHSKLLRNSTIAFDGFTGFTPAQMKVLEQLLCICPDIYIAVTIDARESLTGKVQEHELFALSKKTIQKVTQLAAKKTELLPPVVLSGQEQGRFSKGSMLQHLEQNLFREKRQITPWMPSVATETEGGQCTYTEEISLHALPTPSDEVHFAARRISELVREQQLRYYEIAIITGDMASYSHYMKQIFPMYQIPAFIDETRNIVLNPCLEFLRGALELVQKDFTPESVFRFLRTQMAGLTLDETDILENYVLAAGIRGRKSWSKVWEYLPNGMTPEILEICNRCRQHLMEILLPFAEEMKQKEAPLLHYAKTLYSLLEQLQVQQQLKDRENELLKLQEREQAAEYAQIYGILIHLMDEMTELMGEELVSLKEFVEILEAGVAEAKVGIIPPGIDQVQVGDITRSRLNHVKVLFFLGLNDGWVPSGKESGGIVSDLEREHLQACGIELAPTARENSYTQRFYLYQNLTKPSQRLYLTWCSADGEGKVMRPSYVASAIQRLFPQITVQKEKEALSSIRQVTSKENGMLYFTSQLENVRTNGPSNEWLELYRMYLQEDDYRVRVQSLVRTAFLRGRRTRISYTTSKALYGDIMLNSVTRLEKYAACAFAHFAMYGLKLTPRQLYGVKMSDLGIVFHRALELFSRKLQAEKMDWRQMPEEEQYQIMDHCVEEAMGNYQDGLFHQNVREEYTIQRVKRILNKTIWALHYQLAAGVFEPTGYEISFSNLNHLNAVHVQLEDQSQMHLQGRIDRVDTAVDDEHVYVKIIDYKSGKTTFDPVQVYYGMQLQLVVYLNAALEMEQRLYPEKTAVPAGIFYYHLEDPVHDREEDLSETAVQEKTLKKLRPDGLVNADHGVIDLLDQTLRSESLVIPVGKKRDGGLTALSSVAGQEDFQVLTDYTQWKMKQMVTDIIAGEVSARPFKDKKNAGCDYCDFADVCGFDKKIPGMCEQRVPAIKKDEVYENMRRELEGGDDSGMDEGTASGN